MSEFVKDPVWFKVTSFSIILFFLFLADAILAFWVPNLLEESLKSPLAMGIVISSSSLAGFLVDLVFPQAIKNITVKRLLMGSVAISTLFAFTLLSTLKFPFLFVFLIAMAVWGVYYELFGFAEHQFVADTVPLKLRSGSWAVFGIFKNLAYFLGPLIAAWTLLKSNWLAATSALFFIAIGFGFLLLFKKFSERKFDFELDKVNLITEIGHWRVLFRHVWPVVVLSLLLGLVDSVFWTTGAVLTEKMARENLLGSFFLPLHQLPSLFVGLLMARLLLFKGKKKLAMKFLICSGLVLTILGFTDSMWLLLAGSLVSGIFLSACYPLTNAVYSDIVARMGRNRQHLIGLSNSSISVAYIVGPAIAGYITTLAGETKTFGFIGIFVALVSFVLLMFTPQKIRLPETELKSWQ